MNWNHIQRLQNHDTGSTYGQFADKTNQKRNGDNVSNTLTWNNKPMVVYQSVFATHI